MRDKIHRLALKLSSFKIHRLALKLSSLQSMLLDESQIDYSAKDAQKKMNKKLMKQMSIAKQIQEGRGIQIRHALLSHAGVCIDTCPFLHPSLSHG